MNVDKVVVLEGKGKLRLGMSDHLATGGEGSTYRKGKTAIKIYTDRQVMQRNNMMGKIARLAQLHHATIIAPQGLVYEQGRPVGYYMPYVAGEALSRVFTNAFWKREGFTSKNAISLVDHMRETLVYAHGEGAILVDANEMNWLTVQQGRMLEPRVIDVDSWAIEQWKARVIMPSIRDWHRRGFDEFTDWFAWGIVTFQIFTGIHPYKGTLKPYKRGDMEGRMKANASVFSPDVCLNKAVRDFGIIPGPLRDWYVETFQHGYRGVPPMASAKGIAVHTIAHSMHVTTSPKGTLIAQKVYDQQKVVHVFSCGVLLTQAGDVVDVQSKQVIAKNVARDAHVVAVSDGWLIAQHSAHKPQFWFVHRVSMTQQVVFCDVQGNKLVQNGNRLFMVTDQRLVTLSFQQLTKPMLVAGPTWQVISLSTKWFDGFGVQDTLGVMYLIIPFGDKAVAHVRVPALDAFRMIDGISGERFCALIVLDDAGAYKRIEINFSKDYRLYTIQSYAIDRGELTMTILPKGVIVRITDDNKLDIVVPSRGVTKIIADRFITSDMTLTRIGDNVHLIKDGALWRVRMR